MLTNQQTERYITLKEAADEAGVNLRTIQRWKKHGHIHEIRDRLGHVRVSLEDVMECRKDETDSPAVVARKDLQAKVEALTLRLQQMEARMIELQKQHDLGKQIVAALTSAQVGESGVLSQLLIHLSGSHRRANVGEADRLAKRGLPSGTMRLVDFAKTHQIKVHDLKRAYMEGKIALTVYQRPGEAERNKQEWWLTTTQLTAILTYWQQQGFRYETCSQCPHQEDQTS
jgi:excisionase family DNA binding protein